MPGTERIPQQSMPWGSVCVSARTGPVVCFTARARFLSPEQQRFVFVLLFSASAAAHGFPPCVLSFRFSHCVRSHSLQCVELFVFFSFVNTLTNTYTLTHNIFRTNMASGNNFVPYFSFAVFSSPHSSLLLLPYRVLFCAEKGQPVHLGHSNSFECCYFYFAKCFPCTSSACFCLFVYLFALCKLP